MFIFDFNGSQIPADQQPPLTLIRRQPANSEPDSSQPETTGGAVSQPPELRIADLGAEDPQEPVGDDNLTSDKIESCLNSPLSPELRAAFANATGWELAFHESRESYGRRIDSPQSARTGEVTIIDMSADWPASKPTAHRGLCDKLAQAVSLLVDQLQTAKIELEQLRS